MTLTTPPAPVQRAGIRATVDKVRRRGLHSRVIGISAARSSEGSGLLTDEHGEQVTIRWCPSVLALWDSLTTWDHEGWLVLLTDRTEEEIGPGLLARFAQQRLQRPDSWESVKLRFRATSFERALLDEAGPGDSAIPDALLRLEPQADPDDQRGGWPAARAGVLTRDLVYGAVARRILGITIEPLDGPGLLEAAQDPHLTTALADLRATGSSALADATCAWLSGLLGDAASIGLHAFHAGDPARLLPLGIALDHIITAEEPHRATADLAAVRLETQLPETLRNAARPGVTGPGAQQIAALAAMARTTVQGLLARSDTRDLAERALARAEDTLRSAEALPLVHSSPLLPGGLLARQRALAGSLGHASSEVEHQWEQICKHALADLRDDHDDLRRTLHAAVRVDRWLSAMHAALDAPGQESVGTSRVQRACSAARTHVTDGAWAESALGDVLRGADDAEIAAGLTRLATSALKCRRTLDRTFARSLPALADGEELPTTDMRYLEDILQTLVLPLAQAHAKRPATWPAATSGTQERGGVLVLLVDGMSAAAAADLTSSITGRHDAWREILPTGQQHRTTAVALLPSLTTHSRTSFFVGRPTTGGQEQEREGLAALAREAGLRNAALFHKHHLTRTASGSALPPEISTAISDPSGMPVVAVVLNTIDDALDAADPGGTRWSTSDIRYLRPLLDEARRAGRTVVLTADHGHVVERGGHLQQTPEATSARSRSATLPVGEDEVLVEGRRVLGGPVILAVDEDLRYTSRRAGYHGGASLPEVAVPVVVLRPHPDGGRETHEDWEAELPAGWEFAPDQRPVWWQARPLVPRQETPAPAAEATSDELMLDIPFATPAPTAQPVPAAGLGEAIIASARYRQQVALQRRRPSDEQIAALIDELHAAPGARLTLIRVSQILSTAPARTARVVAVVAQILNVEAFEVLRIDGDSLILDADLARQQFEVP